MKSPDETGGDAAMKNPGEPASYPMARVAWQGPPWGALRLMEDRIHFADTFGAHRVKSRERCQRVGSSPVTGPLPGSAKTPRPFPAVPRIYATLIPPVCPLGRPGAKPCVKTY